MDATSSSSSRLTPTSMPSPFDYSNDGSPGSFTGMPHQPSKQQQYPQSPLQRQPPPQVQSGSASRSNGLLGKMFRKSTSKHPKLNPMGISSKDFFGDGPRSANIPMSVSEYGSSPKGMKLTRKPSSISATALQPGLLIPTASSMQDMVPKSTTALTFGFNSDGIGETKRLQHHGHYSNNSLRNPALYTPPATGHGSSGSRQQMHWPECSPLAQADIGSSHVAACTATVTAKSYNPDGSMQPQFRNRPTRLDISPSRKQALSDTADPASSSLLHDNSALETLSPSTLESAPSSPGLPLDRRMQSQVNAAGSLSALAVSSSDLMEMYGEAERNVTVGAGASFGSSERKKGGGSAWRAKLSLTNLQRPETRSQHHQSFDRSSIDIAAHSRVYSESPLISVPSVAPTSARGNPSAHGPAPLSLDALLGSGSDSTSPQSAPPRDVIQHGHEVSPSDVCVEEMDSVGSLGNIDRDFLLTIQKNSALEARRQRRRETRRNTMSFLGVSNRNSATCADNVSSIPSTPPAGSAARKNNSAFFASADLSADAHLSHGITKEHLSRLAQIDDPSPAPDTATRLADVGVTTQKQQQQEQQQLDLQTHVNATAVQQRSDQGCKSRIGQPEISFTTALPKNRNAAHLLLSGKPRNNRACNDVDSDDGLPSSNKHATTPVSASARCSMMRPRPLSSDSLTYAEQPEERSSSRSSRSNASENAGSENETVLQPRPSSSSATSQKRVLSELNGAVLKESILSAALASAAETAHVKEPKLPAPLETALSTYSISTPTLRSPVLASAASSTSAQNAEAVGMQFSTSAAYSSQSRLVAGMTSSGSVPPVPPLPRNITPAKINKHTTMVSIPSPAITARPGTASAHSSPRPAASNRRYRGSTSVVPSSMSAKENQSIPSFLSPTSHSTASDVAPPPLRPPATQIQVSQSASEWDIESIRLQRYKMAPSSARSDLELSVDCTPSASRSSRNGPSYAAYNSSDQTFSLGQSSHLPLHAGFIRKLSQPDTHMHATSHPLLSPTHSPDILSKSVSNLASARMSVDTSKYSADAKGNQSHAQKHGFGRLFSAASAPRKTQQQKNISVQQHALSSPSPSNASIASSSNMPRTQQQPQQQLQPQSPTVKSLVDDPLARRKIRDQLASSTAFDRLLEEDDFTMAISLTPSVAGVSRTGPRPK
ncbi:hypothetical protein LPJ64_003109 [Coemansia asiatica]|uniref:Uncharacterized protein n=1 Tax=Coemansia asiatica TaxID=1052880 RepID=A0A9W7XLR9_9FUNG|nr:hypothetical protein LPJ64_003109 [Coemansia asiatica]